MNREAPTAALGDDTDPEGHRQPRPRGQGPRWPALWRVARPLCVPTPAGGRPRAEGKLGLQAAREPCVFRRRLSLGATRERTKLQNPRVLVKAPPPSPPPQPTPPRRRPRGPRGAGGGGGPTSRQRGPCSPPPGGRHLCSPGGRWVHASPSGADASWGPEAGPVTSAHLPHPVGSALSEAPRLADDAPPTQLRDELPGFLAPEPLLRDEGRRCASRCRPPAPALRPPSGPPLTAATRHLHPVPAPRLPEHVPSPRHPRPRRAPALGARPKRQPGVARCPPLPRSVGAPAPGSQGSGGTGVLTSPFDREPVRGRDRAVPAAPGSERTFSSPASSAVVIFRPGLSGGGEQWLFLTAAGRQEPPCPPPPPTSTHDGGHSSVLSNQ